MGYSAEGRPLLRDVSFTLTPGEVVGIVGHNGSGKSTMLKLLARQQAPSTGTLLLDGQSLPSWSSRAFVRMVAYLPQTPPSAGALKVRELVACGRYPWHGALGRKSARDSAAVEAALALADAIPLLMWPPLPWFLLPSRYRAQRRARPCSIPFSPTAPGWCGWRSVSSSPGTWRRMWRGTRRSSSARARGSSRRIVRRRSSTAWCATSPSTARAA